MNRTIVNIDPEKCNGCGLCVPSCAEGAIRLVDGKAVLSADNLCDGLGACLGECPQGAITLIQREAEQFDEEAVRRHLGHAPHHPAPAAPAPEPCMCPGSRAMALEPPAPAAADDPSGPLPSRLGHWPVQLHLVSPEAPWLAGADLLVTADCVPFAYAGYHRDFLAGKAVVVGCPKLDDLDAYRRKLTAILERAKPRSVTVLRMEVPCCGGIVAAVRDAHRISRSTVPLEEVVIGVRGEVIRRAAG
jgi:NAD-dependent dihydropyrimidine dehydrogenase PreA subunit